MLKMFRSSAPRFTAKDALARKGDVTLIDVREAAEIKASGQAAGALHIPLSLVVMKADPKSPDYDPRIAQGVPVCVYCASGGRSGMAAQALSKLGYEAHNIGGFGDWVSAGGEISR